MSYLWIVVVMYLVAVLGRIKRAEAEVRAVRAEARSIQDDLQEQLDALFENAVIIPKSNIINASELMAEECRHRNVQMEQRGQGHKMVCQSCGKVVDDEPPRFD